MRWTLLILAIAGASWAVGQNSQIPSSAQAGTAIRMEVEGLVDNADRIVQGRISGRRTLRDQAGRVVTDYEMQVERTFLGQPDVQRTIRIPGGVTADGRGLVLPGMPEIRVGEEVVLFLNGEGMQMPTGMAQGKYRVLSDGQGTQRVMSRTGSLELMGASGASCGGVTAMDYSEFSGRVQARVTERLALEAYGQESNR
ncbi:MAG: hypothetical protein P1V35_02975 [Planctomycetota bacterium]|nr:hypothetical protein [Planctomycetota bacterium]